MPPVDVEEREALAAARGQPVKRTYVRRMFSEIAPSYDLLNHLLSANVDRRWRRAALGALQWQRAASGTYLDLCTGTLDAAASLGAATGFRGSVIGIDFAEPMLREGIPKTRGLPVRPLVADALELPLPDRLAAGALVAFGVRNFDDLDRGLREIWRVLAPGARLVILECSTPRSTLVRWLYHVYFQRVLPRIGALVSGHHTAYRYLPESVVNFPSVEALATRLREAGFANVGWRSLTFGIAALHWGERPA